MDLGDRISRYCVLNDAGEIVREGKVATTTTGDGADVRADEALPDRDGSGRPFAVGEPVGEPVGTLS